MVLVSLFQEERSSSLAGEKGGKIHATTQKCVLRGRGDVSDIKKMWMFDQKHPRFCILRIPYLKDAANESSVHP